MIKTFVTLIEIVTNVVRIPSLILYYYFYIKLFYYNFDKLYYIEYLSNIVEYF